MLGVVANTEVANTEVICIMKELFQAVDIKKWAKKITASAVIASMLMIDATKAMEDDPHLSKVVHRIPSPKPRTADLEIIDSDHSKQSSSSDDSGSSPEKLALEGGKSLPTIPFLGFLQSNQDATSPSTALPTSSLQPLEIVPQSDFGTTPVTGSLQDRIPLPSQTLSGASRTSSSYQDAGPSEKDPLLSSGTSSYGSSNSSHSSSHSSESSSDSDEDVELGRAGHPQPENNGVQGPFERFIARFASTQSPQSSSDQKGSHSSRWKSTSNVIDLRDNEILENGGAPSFLGQGHHLSIQSQDPGDDELTVDVDLIGDENPASQSRFLPTWFSDHPFWPERPEFTLEPGALQRASQFLDPLRSRHAAENLPDASEDERSSSFSASSGSDASPQGSPTSSRYAAPPPDSSESDGDSIAHLLPLSHPHGAISNYASFQGMQSSSINQNLDSMAASAAPYIGPLSPRDAWLQLLDGLKDLSPAAKTQLTDFTHQILHGKSTWLQRLGKWLIGPLIGVGFAWAMGPVYDGGLTYLGNVDEAFNEFLNGNGGNYIVLYINYSAGPDGIARNARLWKKGIASLFSQEEKEVGRMCITGAIAAVTALIPVAYLILAENIPREAFQLPNWDNGFGIVVATFGPLLYIDAFAKDFDTAWKTIPKLEDWFRQARELFFPSSLPPQIRSPEEIQRKKFDGDLTQLKHFLARASNTVIKAIYKDVQDVIAGARSEVDLAAQKAFAAVSYLLSLGDEVQEVAKENAKKSIAELFFDGLEYTCLILGAPTVALLLELVGSTFASLFTSNGGVADSIGGGFALVAFLPFNYVLLQSMDNFKNLIFSKDPQGYESHSAVRLPIKVFIGIQSFVYLFQTSVAVLQSYQKWFGEGWWPFAAAAPFLVARSTGFLNGFNETFNEQITTSAINACHRIGGICKGDSLCSDCQKDWLIRFIESSRSDLEHWSPELIHNLTKGVEIFKNEEVNSSFNEI